MATKNNVLTWKDNEALSVATAHFFVTACYRCIAEKGSFVVALSGGTTPKRLYQLLATPEFSHNIPWDKVFIFWSDERFVPYTDPESNYRMLKENLLDHITIPGKNIFPVPVTKSPKKGAKKYAATIRYFFNKKLPVFDWLLLGIGEDGHTASIFPGTAILKEKIKPVKEVWVKQKESWRISFTLPLINRAAHVVFLVSGKEKSAILAKILHPKKIKLALPAQQVKPVKGMIYWMLDEEAAAKI